MHEKKETARRIVQKVQQAADKETGPVPHFSPGVRQSGEQINKGGIMESGLRQSQAALDIAKSKMNLDGDANPESAAVESMKEDGQRVAQSGADIVRDIVRHSSAKKLNKENAAESPVLSDYTRQTSRPVRKEDFSSPRNQGSPANGSSTYRAGYADQPPTGMESNRASMSAGAGLREQARAEAMNMDKAAQVRASQAARSAQRNAQKAAVQSTARKSTAKATTKVAQAGTKAAKNTASALSKFAAPAFIVAIPVLLIVLLLIIILIVIMSPLGVFFSNNEDNPNQMGGIVSTVNTEWEGELAALRSGYESQGYVVNVYYGAPDSDDSDRVDNWRDVIAVYSNHISKGEAATTVYTDEDVQNIRNLYFLMNPLEVKTWTEEVEVEVEKEVTSEVEKTKYVYNPKTGKIEKVTYTEIVTETVVETEIQVIEHADIWVRNMRYVEVIEQYPMNEKQLDMIAFQVDYRHDALWAALGLSTLADGEVPADTAAILRDLPPGTHGTKIVELASSRLGHPYSMELRGQGNYIDCSGLTQWCYRQIGIELPNTAAEQLRWCVNNGKTIDPGTAIPGDLIFYKSDSPRVSGSYEQIGHVGIYAGNGMMIDASSSRGCVVYRAVYGSPYMWARPHV